MYYHAYMHVSTHSYVHRINPPCRCAHMDNYVRVRPHAHAHVLFLLHLANEDAVHVQVDGDDVGKSQWEFADDKSSCEILERLDVRRYTSCKRCSQSNAHQDASTHALQK